MNKKIFRILTLNLSAMLLSSILPISSYAYNENDLKAWVKDNYWVELENYNNNLVPKGVNIAKTSFVGKDIEVDDAFGAMWANTGIRTDRPALFDMSDSDTPEDSKLIIDDLKGIAERDYSSWNDAYHTGGKLWNPLNFDTEKDLIKNINDFNIYGDLLNSKTNNSTDIETYNVGDSIDLDLSVNLSLFKNVKNVSLVSITNSKSDIAATQLPLDGKGYTLTDDKFAFTFDFPKGIVIDNSTRFELRGLEGYTLKPEVIKDDSTGKKIIVYADEDTARPILSVSEYFKKLNKSNGNVILSIKNVKITDSAQRDMNLTIKSSIAGMYDFAMTSKKSILENHSSAGLDRDTDFLTRNFMVFAAKQSNEGRDANAPADKPNLISYTFKVTKAPDNPYRPHRPDVPNPGRIDGPDRIETGINISKKYYDKAKSVIVVRHDLFPDSMTASVLAKLKDAPILLNPTNKLDPRVAAEIKRLGAEEVIIVGGPDSISENVRGDLKVYDKDKEVERIAGVDRYGTSEMVARRVVGITGKKYTGVVASGQVFPDALSVGTFASRDGYPILLVKKDMVPDQVERAIKDLEIRKTYIAGGTNTISKLTEAKLPSVVERMAGKDRYETSVAIAKSKFKDSRDAFIASGEEFADALVISPVSGKYNRPTLLASRNKTSNALVKKYISDTRMHTITAIGGERYLPYSILLDLVGR